jgi:uncharacterized membrane protein
MLLSALNWLGSIICHQDPAKILTVGSLSTWLCLRCAGVYSGYLLVSVRDLLVGRKFEISYSTLFLSGLLMMFCLGDATLFPRSPGLQDEVLRYLTGFAAGVGIALTLNAVAFRRYTPPPKNSRLLLPLATTIASLSVAIVALRPPWVVVLLNTCDAVGFWLLAVMFNAALLSNIEWLNLQSLRSPRFIGVTFAMCVGELAAIATLR